MSARHVGRLRSVLQRHGASHTLELLDPQPADTECGGHKGHPATAQAPRAVVVPTARTAACATVSHMGGAIFGQAVAIRTVGARLDAASGDSMGTTPAVTAGRVAVRDAITGAILVFVENAITLERADIEPEFASLIRLTVAVILLTASVAKARHPGRFLEALTSLLSVRRPLGSVLAWCIISAELFIGLGLLLGWMLSLTNLVGAALFAGFGTVAAIRLWPAKGHPTCGCLGGALALRLGWSTVFLNFVLAVGLIAASTTDAYAVPLPLDAEPIAPLDALVLWLCAGLLATLYWAVFYAESVAIGVNDSLSDSATGRELR